jgi:uncharacterized membrane protein YebE (DUF533 family)
MIVLLLALILVVLLCGSKAGRGVIAAIIGTAALVAVVMVVISLYVDWRKPPQPTFTGIADNVIARQPAEPDARTIEQATREANRLKIAHARQVYEQAAGREDTNVSDLLAFRLELEATVRRELDRQRAFDEAHPTPATMDEIFCQWALQKGPRWGASKAAGDDG